MNLLLRKRAYGGERGSRSTHAAAHKDFWRIRLARLEPVVVICVDSGQALFALKHSLLRRPIAGSAMGHSRFGIPPTTRAWAKVVELIVGNADVGQIAWATSDAVERSLHKAGHDPALQHAFYLLTQVPLAAKAKDFQSALRRLGIFIDGPITLWAVCSGFVEAIDRAVQSGKDRTDLGELATISAVESLGAVAGRESPNLFGTNNDAAETRESLANLAAAAPFGVLARDFFARLTRRYLEYYLSRELPNRVGVKHRFRSIREHMQFEQALDVHCREAAVIAQDYAAGWFSKNVHEGGITPKIAGDGVRYAFGKMRSELRRRSNGNA